MIFLLQIMRIIYIPFLYGYHLFPHLFQVVKIVFTKTIYANRRITYQH